MGPAEGSGTGDQTERSPEEGSLELASVGLAWGLDVGKEVL